METFGFDLLLLLLLLSICSDRAHIVEERRERLREERRERRRERERETRREKREVDRCYVSDAPASSSSSSSSMMKQFFFDSKTVTGDEGCSELHLWSTEERCVNKNETLKCF